MGNVFRVIVVRSSNRRHKEKKKKKIINPFSNWNFKKGDEETQVVKHTRVTHPKEEHEEERGLKI